MANPNSKLEVSKTRDTYRARNIYYRKLKNDVSYSFSFRLDKKLAFVTVGREVRDRLTLEKLMNANEDFERLMREYNVVPTVEAVNGKINISLPKEITKDYSKFDDIAQYYFEHKKELSNTHNLTLAYNKNMKDFFSAYKIEDITHDVLMKFRAFLYAKKIGVKKVDGKMTAGRKMSDKTVQDYLNNIKTIFNYAIQQNKFKFENPAKDITMKKIDNARNRFLSASEIKQVLDKVKNDITFYSFALLALNTGARGRSVMNIKKSDIEDGRVIIKDFKNNSTYNGFLSEEVMLLLKLNELDSNSYVVSRKNRENKESDYTALTKYFQKNIFHDLFNKNLAEHDIKNRVVVHTFRHTFGSQLANKDTDVYVIKELMNHSDIKSTIRYAKLRDETLRQKAIQLNFS